MGWAHSVYWTPSAVGYCMHRLKVSEKQSVMIATLVLLLVTWPLTDTSPLSTSSVTGGSCPPGVQCQHGHCAAGDGQCVCEEGWAGWQCQEPCPDLCVGDGECLTASDGTPYCLCNGGLRFVSGKGCVTDTLTVSPISSTPVTAAANNNSSSSSRSNNTTSINNTSDSTAAPTSITVTANISVQELTTTTTTTASLITTTTTTLATTTTTNTTTTTTTITTPTTTTTTITSSTTEPASARTCVPGFVCQHGRCAADSVRCECHEGWSGIFCTERCSKNCTSHGRCMIHLDGTSYCSCDELHFGEFCEDEMVSTAAYPPSTIILPLTANTSAQPTNRTVPPVTESTCNTSIACVHGHCDSQSSDPLCVCDWGWHGPLCDRQCTLNCGAHGTCYTMPHNSSITACRCRDGYSGPLCSTVASDSSKLGKNATSPSVDWDMSDLRPMSERHCVPGFVCLHGRCNESDVQCQCDPGYVGTFCHIQCPVDCTNGECMPSEQGTAYCSCQPMYTGDNCSEIRALPVEVAQNTPLQWYIVGTCAGLLVVVVVVAVVVCYWMWKRGHIFLMKIVYHFKAFEDDDDKQYDAFISYSNSDEEYVTRFLLPKLIEMNFSICVHRKDFIAGETIANNIIEAVENSRRTILVLTPHFVQSQFCRFEYQQAQYQMIQHKHRIIPIVLKDISREKKNMDATLRSILNTITYLDWPIDSDFKQTDKFWKRLELSMPKRKTAAESPAQSESSAYCRLDYSSSGYSSASSASGNPSNYSSSFSRTGKNQQKASHKSAPSSAHRTKRSRSVSGQPTSGPDSRRSQLPSSRPTSKRSGSRSRSESRSWSKVTRAESVIVEMNGGKGRVGSTGSNRQGLSNPTYWLP